MSLPLRRPLTTRTPIARSRRHLAGLAAGLFVLAASAPFSGVGAAAPTAAPADQLRPTIQYEEAVAHADDRINFAPGERVSVPFAPRAADDWDVAGDSPRRLPAGRLDGRSIRSSQPGARVIDGEPGGAQRPAASDAAAAPCIDLLDAPIVDPQAAAPTRLAAVVSPGGLRREVFGFLPYWELTDASTTLDWEKLSTIAYFGVGAAANGNLELRNSDGSTTVGWSGWTSSRMTEVIETAHANGTRVVLTIQSFAWNSSGVTKQKALLGSETARANLARQIAAAVRDRGADGVNLDVEPIVSGYADEFTALVQAVRAELDAIAPGYQLTFDATGYIGNYPIEAATAPGGADAIVIMGYDYKGSSSGTAGSIAPIGGPVYDIADTLAAYSSRVPASQLILGVPYYGRAWSTSTSALNSPTVSAVKYGASVTALYETAIDLANTNGRQYDPVEGVAWTAYRRETCTSTYGCVTSWRQLYYDDAETLAAKYDLVNQYGIRGAAIWALGYDGSRPELYEVIKSKFITDTVAPVITSSSLSAALFSPNADGRLDTTTVRLTATGLTRYGWRVEPLLDGVPGAPVLEGVADGTNPEFTWDGRGLDGLPVPDGTYQVTVWTADASDNRSQVQKLVTVDTIRPALTSSAAPVSISPNGDGRYESTTVRMGSDELVRGKARILDKNGAVVRSWELTFQAEGGWTWDGKDAAGKLVPDGRYSFRVDGIDASGNGTVQIVPVLVDRTIAGLTWASSSFRPAAGQRDVLSLRITRAAKVTAAIYQGNVLVRRIWTNKEMAAGTWKYSWNGRDLDKAVVPAGKYTVRVTTTSWIGDSGLTRTVTVKGG